VLCWQRTEDLYGWWEDEAILYLFSWGFALPFAITLAAWWVRLGFISPEERQRRKQQHMLAKPDLAVRDEEAAAPSLREGVESPAPVAPCPTATHKESSRSLIRPRAGHAVDGTDGKVSFWMNLLAGRGVVARIAAILITAVGVLGAPAMYDRQVETRTGATYRVALNALESRWEETRLERLSSANTETQPKERGRERQIAARNPFANMDLSFLDGPHTESGRIKMANRFVLGRKWHIAGDAAIAVLGLLANFLSVAVMLLLCGAASVGRTRRALWLAFWALLIGAVACMVWSGTAAAINVEVVEAGGAFGLVARMSREKALIGSFGTHLLFGLGLLVPIGVTRPYRTRRWRQWGVDVAREHRDTGSVTAGHRIGVDEPAARKRPEGRVV
jgi:hypothetical protein